MHTETSQIYRKMNPQSFATAQYSGNSTIETFIYNTKEIAFPKICEPGTDNLTVRQRKTIVRLQIKRHQITIKPADKNLGMDTDDYLAQCVDTLKNHSIYR